MNCKVCGNQSSKTGSTVAYFRFPLKESICRDWAERCLLSASYEKLGAQTFYKSFRICSDHFASKYIYRDPHRQKLLYGAIPELKLTKEMGIVKFEELEHEAEFQLRLVQNMCRLCAQEHHGLTDIFGSRGKSLELEKKMKFLPIMLHAYDVLPLKICQQCIVYVTMSYNFFMNCVKAEEKLKLMLDMEECETTYNVIKERFLNSETTEQEENELISFKKNNTDVLQKVDVREQEINMHCPKENIGNTPMCHSVASSDVEMRVIQCSADVAVEGSSSNNVLLFITKLPGSKDVEVSPSDVSHSSKDTEQDNAYSSGGSLNKHKGSKLENVKYSCDICHKNFPSRYIMQAHKKAHWLKPDSDGMFVCQLCSKTFKTKYRLNEHHRVHTGELPYNCDMCSKRFHKLALLKQHSIIHSTSRAYKCSLCRLRSHRKYNLTKHVKKHLTNAWSRGRTMLNTCRVCLHSFPAHQLLETHRKQVHESLTEGLSYLCPFCQQVFSVESEWEQHKIQHSEVICGLCQQHVTGKSIQLHFKSHAPSKPSHQCVVCKRRFKTRDHLTAHSATHAGDMPFDCEKCGKTLSSKASLVQHGNVHSNVRQFTCAECGQSFKRKATLRNHSRTHSGERPFACTTCGFAFKQRGDCLKHEKNHQQDNEKR